MHLWHVANERHASHAFHDEPRRDDLYAPQSASAVRLHHRRQMFMHGQPSIGAILSENDGFPFERLRFLRPEPDARTDAMHEDRGVSNALNVLIGRFA